MDERRLRAIMSGDGRGIGPAAARAALRAVEPLYASMVSLRNAMFDLGLRKVHHLGRLTISVGNLTTGGTGKTPMVIEIVRRLQAIGHRPAVLLRGHGGRNVRPAMSDVRCEEADILTDQSPESVPIASPDIAHRTSHIAHPPRPRAMGSDEAQEYSAAFDNSIPVAADADRVRSARWVLHHHPEVTCFVLDDAFQHRKVHRDIDLVLIDATCPWGYGHVLPRGMLREPVGGAVGKTVGGLRRADAVILTRSDSVDEDTLANISAEVERLTGRLPIAEAEARWDSVTIHRTEGWESSTLSSIKSLSFIVACGIGNPASFIAQAERHSGDVKDTNIFADHHWYSQENVDRLTRQVAESGADGLLMTRKDWVKWEKLWDASTSPITVWVPNLTTHLRGEGGEAVDALLGNLPIGRL